MVGIKKVANGYFFNVLIQIFLLVMVIIKIKLFDILIILERAKIKLQFYEI